MHPYLYVTAYVISITMYMYILVSVTRKITLIIIEIKQKNL